MRRESPSAPVCVIDVVGLTSRHLGPDTPVLRELADGGTTFTLQPALPAVTCTAQATMLTGQSPSVHGIVANGWLYRDSYELRLWQQSNHLLQAEPLYVTARRRATARGEPFSVAKLFWWFNEGARVDWSLTPKPFYGSDGSKELAIHGSPAGFAEASERALGAFPFPSFWGPTAGLRSSEWIAAAAARTLRDHRPRLSLIYLPHLDYDLQRFGPRTERLSRVLREIDSCVANILGAAREIGATIVILSEYQINAVHGAVALNQHLRREGWLVVRDGPFGEQIDLFNSRAFALCDHQIAHVYVDEPSELPRVRARLETIEGVRTVLEGEERAEAGLLHPRSGELILLSDPDRWFCYPYWLDERRAPDFARTVDIHRKCGYDPCELLFDPHIPLPRLRAGLRLLQKKLGLRYRMDVVPLDPSLVRGSHGLPPVDPQDGPILIGPARREDGGPMAQRAVRDYLLDLLGLGEQS